MDYASLIPLLAYVGALQLSAKYNVRPLTSAVVATVLPFGITLFLKYIYLSGYNLPIAANLFSVAVLLVVLFQFLVAIVLFNKLQEEDAISSWFVWGIFGFFTIYLLIPFVVNALVRV